MSENNKLAGWQKAIEYMNSYEPTDKLSEALQRIKELESQLAEAKKDQARYQFVRDMSADDFEDLSTDNSTFDAQIDEAMQENQQ